MSFNYEHELIHPVHNYFASAAEMIFYEVPIGFCRADMIVFQKDKTSIAIELKLADWKKALIQAQNYQLATDFVYLAFPFSKCELVLKRAKNKLQQKGIGLLSVNEVTKQVTLLVAAKKSTVLFGRLSKKEVINQKKRVYRRKRL
ncbi:MAG TPA: hypothetical protein VKP59_03940 [Candidatus Thermoplasmatota archaeon]|nr:hypothetical protein [Candidatus Thermoplasmatota archaeon]